MRSSILQKQLKVLLIDDNKPEALRLQHLINQITIHTYDFEWVDNFNLALQRIRLNSHEIYLVDFAFGEQNNFQLITELLKDNHKKPIILLTNKASHGKAQHTGASDCLIKETIEPDLLERAMQLAIEKNSHQQKILSLSYYDNLTNLPNRVLFKEQLGLIIRHNQRHKRLCAILFVDIDNFKRINTTLGYAIGDLLIKEISLRLTPCVRKSDSISVGFGLPIDTKQPTIARVGGDEFIILLSEIKDVDNAGKVAHRIIKELEPSFTIQGYEIFITVSIGIAIYPSDGQDIDTLLKNSDIAMCQAKNDGKNTFKYYKRSMNAAAYEKLVIENDLHYATERDEFRIFYQPQYDLKKRNIVGMEALIRWQHPKKGLLSPNEFISIAEESGIIIPMSQWVLSKVCLQNKMWQDSGFRPISVSVNISAINFERYNIVDFIKTILKETALQPQYLTLEITETILMKNVEYIVALLNELHSIGIKFSIDDFGTGYSSLSYLRTIPLTYIKIDQSFISEIILGTESENIVKVIIELAHNLNKIVVAEGVETKEQLDFLISNNCDILQGYLHSRPLPSDLATNLLAKDNDHEVIDFTVDASISESSSIM